MQLFDTTLNALAKMSKTPLNYWAEFAVDIPLSAALIFAGLRNRELTSWAVFLTVLLGLFFFSFFEYAIHRKLLHGSIQVLVQGHRAHHANPLGYDALPFFLPALLLLTLVGILVLVLPANYTFLLCGAMTAGYVDYGFSHFIIHHHRFHQVIARNWAANHHIHHYHSDTNFGVTTPLWDGLLGTRFVSDHKRI